MIYSMCFLIIVEQNIAQTYADVLVMNSGVPFANTRLHIMSCEERQPLLSLHDNVNYGVQVGADCANNSVETITLNEYEVAQQENNINGNYVIRNVPVNLMPPPQHSIISVSKEELRSTSPQDSESDESCRSFSCLPSDNGARQRTARNNCSSFSGNNLLFNKYSSSSPNVFFYTTQSQNGRKDQANKKVRYYVNSCARHKRDGKRRPPQDIYCRVHGLMERFTSRASLMRIPASPPTSHSQDHLSQSIWDVFCAKAQKEQTYVQKLELWKFVYLHIRKSTGFSAFQKILLRYGLFMVGSTMSGLGTDTSDIDMCLLVKPCLNDPRSDALRHLQNIQIILRSSDFIINPEIILAKVPILKFRDSRHGFEVDLNCNNAVGIRNTHLLHCYAHLDWRVRPLVIVVKLWAQANDINDAKRMTISSYSLALMVIHYLQCGVNPPVLPCLHSLYPEKFSADTEIYNIDIQEELGPFYSNNKRTLGELFLGFLRYYSAFDYDQYAISVREGSVLFKEECRYTRSQKNDAMQWKLLCIEEPFDLTNTARCVYDADTFEHIKYVFHYSYKALNDSSNLNSIFPVNQR